MSIKRLVSMISLMMVMITIRGFQFDLISLTLSNGPDVTNIRDNYDKKDPISITVEEESRDEENKTVRLTITGILGGLVLFNDLDQTSGYEELTEGDFEERYLVFDCKTGNGGDAIGSIKGNNFDKTPVVTGKYNKVPDRLKEICGELGQAIPEEPVQSNEEDRRLILI